MASDCQLDCDSIECCFRLLTRSEKCSPLLLIDLVSSMYGKTMNPEAVLKRIQKNCTSSGALEVRALNKSIVVFYF